MHKEKWEERPRRLFAQGVLELIVTLVIVIFIGILAIAILNNVVHPPPSTTTSTTSTSSTTSTTSSTSTTVAPVGVLGGYYSCYACQALQSGYSCPPGCPIEVDYPDYPCTRALRPVGCFQPTTTIPCCTSCESPICGYTCCGGYTATADSSCRGVGIRCSASTTSTSTTVTTISGVTGVPGPAPGPTTIQYYTAASQTGASAGTLSLPGASGSPGTQSTVQGSSYTQFLCAGGEGCSSNPNSCPGIGGSWGVSTSTSYTSVGIQSSNVCSLHGDPNLAIAGAALNNPPAYTVQTSSWNPAWWLDVPVTVTKPNSFVVVVGSCGINRCTGYSYYPVPYGNSWYSWLPPGCSQSSQNTGADAADSAFVIVCPSLSQSYYIRIWGTTWPSLLGGGMSGAVYVYHS